jgi:hypothetical protein
LVKKFHFSKKDWLNIVCLRTRFFDVGKSVKA